MNRKDEMNFLELRKIISSNKKIINELINASLNIDKTKDEKEKTNLDFQIRSLENSLRKNNRNFLEVMERVKFVKPLNSSRDKIKTLRQIPSVRSEDYEIKEKGKELSLMKLEKETLKRLKNRKEKIKVKKVKKASNYIRISNSLFSKLSLSFLDSEFFRPMKKDLTKANLDILPVSFISVILLTTLLSFFFSILVVIFFLFFNIVPELPIITIVEENIISRLGKVFWIVLLAPVLTFIFMYFYPSMERKSSEERIDQELPFATIHMSAISGSMIDPTKIFTIIISTKEYPYLEKEFTKLLNEINIYGFDLVSALRNGAFNSPSKKLAELFNGLATTINSGGNLPEFFDKRSQSLLFDYRLEREKYTRSAETFMDIYISLVIAAPMILMLLLMMIKISGLGISLSTSMITLIMILGVSVINVVFLTFLHLKQPAT